MKNRPFSLHTLSLALLLCLASTSQAFFNPTVGKWASRDPIGERGGYNLTAFVRNDPILEVDFLGLFLTGCRTPCKSCCCADSLSVKGVYWFLRPNGTGFDMGQGFDVEAKLSYVAAPPGYSGNGQCSLDWFESVSAGSTAGAGMIGPGETGILNTGSGGSSTFSGWRNRPAACPKTPGTTDTIVMHDEPFIKIGPGAGIPERDLTIDIRLKSAAGCPCPSSGVTTAIFQKLRARHSTPDWYNSGLWVLE